MTQHRMEKKKKIKSIKRKKKAHQKRGGIAWKSFRLSGKHLFLTYSQFDQSKEEVYSQLKEKLMPRRVESYVIADEDHKDGSKHIHVYVELDNRCDIRDSRRLDLKDREGVEKHGNYQSCRCYRNVVGYIVKHGLSRVLTNKNLDDNGRELDGWGEIAEMAEKGDYAKALEKIRERSPRTYVMEYSKIKGNLRGIVRDNTSGLRNVYELEKFEVPEKLLFWHDLEMKEKTLYMYGATGTGKTEIVKSLLARRYGAEQVLRVTNWEGLKGYDSTKHKAIILDDISMEGKTMEEKISIVDVKNEADIRVLYEALKIEPGIVRAILSNKSEDKYFGIGGAYEDSQGDAIRRRIRVLKITERVWKIRQISVALVDGTGSKR